MGPLSGPQHSAFQSRAGLPRPQLLSAAAGHPCRNLDLNLCGQAWVEKAFLGYGSQRDLALVEGVMGLFDGIGCSEAGSTAAIAKQLQLPVVLVIDAGGQAASLGALVQGFRDHDPDLTLAVWCSTK